MQLENITTPQEDSTPQLRYASLHRTVERGLASDEVLRELVEICLQLGHLDEAVRVHSTMKAGPTRDHVGALLARRGLIHRSAEHQVVEDDGLGDTEPSIAEHALDAVQFLCQSHMPAVALLTMLSFPLVVGLGGFLTAGGSPWLFAGLAALPGLCVLGVVGAMGRQIFLQSADGDEDVPPIPAPAEMVQAAKRYLTDVMIVLGALLAPSLTLLWFNAPMVSSLPGLAIGMFLTPMALILRQVRGDFGALSPVALIRGIGCCNGYIRVAGTFWTAFAPAAVAFWTTLSHAAWLQIAIVGPLAVLPMFGTARLLGTFADSHRSRLGLLLHPQGRAAKPATGKPVAAKATANAGKKPAAAGAVRKSPLAAFAKRRQPATHTPLAPRQTQGPAVTALGNMHPQLAASRPAPTAAPKPAPRAPVPPAKLPPKPQPIAHKVDEVTPQPAGLARRPQPEDWAAASPKKTAPAAQIEGRAPKASTKPTAAKPAAKAPAAPAAKPAVQPVAKPAPKAPAAPAPRVAQKATVEPLAETGLGGPDLSNIPGATIITGEDRERLGAASRKS